MKFMIMRLADKNTEAGIMPSAALLQAMGNYNMALVNAGLMVDGMGLKPTSAGARIQFNSGVPTITDGPFTESKELLAGFTLIQTRSKQEALDWVKKWPVEDGDGNAHLELRQIYELEDFAPSVGLSTHYDVDEKLRRQPNSMSVHVTFNGNCREALEFYQTALGGHILMMNMHTDAPANEHANIPPGMADKVMHAQIQIGPYLIMGCDAPADFYYKPAGFSLQMSIDDIEQAEKTFALLAQDGEIQMPMAETFWANRFGMVIDRFGIPWMINSGYKMF